MCDVSSSYSQQLQMILEFHVFAVSSLVFIVVILLILLLIFKPIFGSYNFHFGCIIIVLCIGLFLALYTEYQIIFGRCYENNIDDQDSTTKKQNETIVRGTEEYSVE